MSNMTNDNEVRLIDIDTINHHPKQFETYGEIEVDEIFIQSIRDNGIIQPVILGHLQDDTELYCVSGHRRLKGAQITNLLQVPAIIRCYQNLDEMELEFLMSNFQREKTLGQRIREFMQYKQLLCHIGLIHKSQGITGDPIYIENEFLSALKNYAIDPDKPLNSIDIIKDAIGFTEWEQRLLNTIFSEDKLEKQLAKWQSAGLKAETQTKIFEEWENVRDKVRSGDVTMREGYDTINALIKDVDSKLAKKNKKPAKAEKAEPKPKVNKYEIDARHLEDLPADAYYCANTDAHYWLHNNMVVFTCNHKDYFGIPFEKIVELMAE